MAQKSTGFIAMFLAAAMVIGSGVALADKGGKGFKEKAVKSKQFHGDRGYRHDGAVAPAGGVFDDDESRSDRGVSHTGRGNTRDYLDADSRYTALPPGLRKKMARGESLPPGWARKLERGEAFPRSDRVHAPPGSNDLRDRLRAAHDGAGHGADDEGMARWAEAADRIVDVLGL